MKTRDDVLAQARRFLELPRDSDDDVVMHALDQTVRRSIHRRCSFDGTLALLANELSGTNEILRTAARDAEAWMGRYDN